MYKQLQAREDTKIVKVHSATIHVENKVSLISRKAWFYFIYRALPTIMLQDEFVIPISDLKEAINYTSSNNKHLKEMIKELTHTTIEFNIFNKSRSSWEINVLLASCKIENGLCSFSFSPMLKPRLANPEMYVKLDLFLSRQFKSKHSLALYSLALDYLYLKDNYGEKNLTVDEMRKFLGLEKEEYVKVANINREIIKRAVKEINETSDMEIDITPIVIANRKITGFKMKMRMKPEYLDNYNSIKDKSEIYTKQIEPEKPKEIIHNLEKFDSKVDIKSIYPSKTIEKIERENPKEISRSFEKIPNKIELKSINSNTIIEKLSNKITNDSPISERIKIKDEILNKFFSQYRISISTNTVQEKLRDIKLRFHDEFEDYLTFLMKYTNQELKRQSINNISGFYVGLLKDDSQIDNYIIENKQKEIDKKNNSFKLKNLVNKEIKKDYDNYLSGDFYNYLIDNMDELENEISHLIESTVSSGTYLYDMILAKNNFTFTRDLLTDQKSKNKSFLMNHLNNYKNSFDYEPLTFEEWKNQEITEEFISELETKLSNN